MAVRNFIALRGAILVAATLGIASCAQVLGLGDYKEGEGSGGATSSSSSTNASTSAVAASASASSSASTGVGGGTPAKLVVDKLMQDFGSQVTNTPSPTETLTFTNMGEQPTGTISTQLSGANIDQFSIMTDGCNGISLAGGGSCAEVLVFRPQSSGQKLATLIASASPGGNPAVNLSGAGILPGMIGINPTMHDFLTHDVGSSSANQDYVITNTGGQATGPLATAITDPTNDFIVTDGCANMALPAVTGACTISVVFKPASFGPKTLNIAAMGTPGGNVNATATGAGLDYFPLDVTFAGNGAGTITSAPSGINCTANCNAIFPHGAMVILTAAQSMGSTFSGWSGAGCSGTGMCMVPMNMAQSVTATFALKSYTLTVTKNFIGASTGNVMSTSPAAPTINCGGSCTAVYLYGTNVTLAANPGPGYYLKDWSNGIASTSYAPTFPITGDMTVTATFTPPNKIFASTKVYTGNIGGTAAANLECNTEAAAASIPGTYVAWLSTSTVDAGSAAHLNFARGWVRPDGLPFGDTATLIAQYQVTGGHTWYPPRLTAAGADVGAGYWFATGTQGGLHQTGFMCADWTSTAGNSVFGLADTGVAGWGASGSAGCSPNAFHLACLGTDYQAVVRVVAPPNPRFIFLSKAPFGAATGVTAANTICTNEATSAGLPGTYKALLAPTGATAGSLFVAHNQPVTRPDGVVVAVSDASFLAIPSAIRAALEIAADGTVPVDTNGAAFTGAASVTAAGTNATTCNNWSTNSGAATGTSGLTNYSAGTTYFNNALSAQPNCDNAAMRVYCLQN